MKIILTGGAGFIGSCFLWQLNAMGIDDILVADAHDHAENNSNLKGKKFRAYLSRKDLLARLEKGQLKDMDGIVHLGACTDTTERDWNFLLANNTEYSKTLARWAIANDKFFHYASSAAVYGDGRLGYKDDDAFLATTTPLNPYGKSKWLFDEWLIKEKLTSRVVGYRYFNVFGPNERHKNDMRSMVVKAFDQIKESGRARLFATTRDGYPDGSEERDFVYVKDVNRVMAYFIEHPEKGGICNVGTGQARSFKDLVTAVFAALGKPPSIEYISMPEALKCQYQYFTQADLTKLREAGYKENFQSLETAVADYVKTHLMQTDSYL